MKNHILIRFFLFAFLAMLLLVGESQAERALFLKFDEGKGKETKDSSPTGLVGKIQGDPKWVDGKEGKCLEFDGKDDFVEFALDEKAIARISGMDALAAMFWTYPLEGNTVDYKYLFHQRSDIYWARIHELHYQFGMRNDKNQDTYIEGPKFQPNKWIHIALTYDGKKFRVYLDFQLLEEKPAQVGKLQTTRLGEKLYIASDPPTSPLRRFHGRIDEYQVYNTALTLAEIRSNAKAVVNPRSKLAITWGDIKITSE